MSFTSRLLSDIPAFLDMHETAAFPYSEMAPVKLVHSNIVHEYLAPQAERPHADAMFTAVSGQKIGVVTADCLPLLMASRDGRYICSVHAGWRGAASGIIENSLALFQRYHVAPQDLVVVSGPHIHACCYEVTADFYQALLAMPAGGAGVPDENMEWLGSCTYCTPQLLGSFRRRTHFPAPKSFQYSWIMREPDSAGR